MYRSAVARRKTNARRVSRHSDQVFIPGSSVSTVNPDLARFIVDFAAVPGTECVCGVAHRAFADEPRAPASFHITDISRDAQVHYHKTISEFYYFLECEPQAAMELDGNRIPVRPGMCILIVPGIRHRAIGKMRVIIVAVPRFDPADEWLP
jgi:mannose-6-phosphate isomerase-like protein (cupin superfamily)